MQPASFAAPRGRSHYRHELGTLTYVTLYEANSEQGNGQETNVGVIRNLNHRGAFVRLVAPVSPRQRLRMRFELKGPRVRVETHVEVTWTGSSGQCGVCFVDLPARTCQQINEWIFANLLGAAARESDPEDGLIVSASPRPAIQLGMVSAKRESHQEQQEPQAPVVPQPRTPPPREQHRPEKVNGQLHAVPSARTSAVSPHYSSVRLPETAAQNSWLSQPLSGRTLAWLVDSLVMIAALLFFALIFVAIAHELPPWPLTLALVLGAAVFVGLAYWILFEFWGGASLGVRLAETTSGRKSAENGKEANRFR
jgi:hypothetical protein